VNAIVKNGRLGNQPGKCLRCQEHTERICALEVEGKRLSVVIVNLTDEKGRLNEELSRATSDISTLEMKKSDLETDLRRMSETHESEMAKLK